MRDFAIWWYSVLNALFATVGVPLREVAAGAGGSFTAAVLLGIIGALSPCQLSTNASAIAYLGQAAGKKVSHTGWLTASYIAGKVLVYSTAGLLAVALGQGLAAVTIPTAIVARKALGPLMILISLAMLGLWRPRLSIGQALSLRIRDLAQGGMLGAFSLGVAFSFAFCPTLGLLFFGYVIPMALISAAGPLYPAGFALGTTFPLIIATSLLMASTGTRAEKRLTTWEPWLKRVAGLIFLLVGVNDTVLYWFL
jgi:cytochrome c biogenesis protein CcdA